MTLDEAYDILRTMLDSDSEDSFLLRRERDAVVTILEARCSKTNPSVNTTGKPPI